jgi:hypothetical protein
MWTARMLCHLQAKGADMKQLKVFGMAVALVCVLGAAAAATAGASAIKYTGSGRFSI